MISMAKKETSLFGFVLVCTIAGCPRPELIVEYGTLYRVQGTARTADGPLADTEIIVVLTLAPAGDPEREWEHRELVTTANNGAFRLVTYVRGDAEAKVVKAVELQRAPGVPIFPAVIADIAPGGGGMLIALDPVTLE